jgi:hypothetical protein
LRRQGADATQTTIQRWQAALSEILSHLRVILPKPASVSTKIGSAPPALPLTGLDTLILLRRERRRYFLTRFS